MALFKHCGYALLAGGLRRVCAQVAAEVAAREAAAGADGQARKRGRGRPVGSKSKVRPASKLRHV